MNKPVILVEHLTKEFQLGQLTGLGRDLRNAGRRVLGRPVLEREPFKALDDVSFAIQPGEVVGIIGHNGAGKSTLLKTLAGISRGTRGEVNVRGRVAPLIEVGAGLVPDMTGRENVFLNAAILGMKRAEIRRKFDEIVAFAEMEAFIDTPVKRYSSGMQVRLGFAIATAVDAEILIVDEVLAVGDLAFQRKCYDRIEGFVRSGDRTLLLVSHNLRQIERLCTRVLMLNRGRLEADDRPKQVCEAFLNQSNAKIVSDRKAAGSIYESSGELSVTAVEVRGRSGAFPAGTVLSGEDIVVDVTFDLAAALSQVTFTIAIHTTDLFFIAFSSSDTSLEMPELRSGRHRATAALGGLRLTPGAYAVYFAAESGRASGSVFRADNLAIFQVVSSPAQQRPASERFGVICTEPAWTIAAEPAAVPMRREAGQISDAIGLLT